MAKYYFGMGLRRNVPNSFRIKSGSPEHAVARRLTETGRTTRQTKVLFLFWLSGFSFQELAQFDSNWIGDYTGEGLLIRIPATQRGLSDRWVHVRYHPVAFCCPVKGYQSWTEWAVGVSRVPFRMPPEGRDNAYMWAEQPRITEREVERLVRQAAGEYYEEISRRREDLYEHLWD